MGEEDAGGAGGADGGAAIGPGIDPGGTDHGESGGGSVSRRIGGRPKGSKNKRRSSGSSGSSGVKPAGVKPAGASTGTGTGASGGSGGGHSSRAGSSSRASEELVLEIRDWLKIAAGMYQATRPAPLQSLWAISEEELDRIARKAEKCRGLLPDGIEERIDQYAAPAGLAAAVAIVVIPRMMMEREYVASLRASQSGYVPPAPAGNGGVANAPAPDHSDHTSGYAPDGSGSIARLF